MARSRKCATTVVYIVLSAYAICAIAVLSIGLWLYHVKNTQTILFGQSLVYTVGLILIIAGGVFLGTILIGFIATRCSSDYIMKFFLGLMIITFAVLVTAGGFTAYVHKKLTATFEDHMEENLKLYYGFEADLTNAWDSTQYSLRCCGVTDGRVYASARWSVDSNVLSPRIGLVPDSCCARFANNSYVDLDKCHQAKPNEQGDFIYTQGCYQFIGPTIEVTLLGTIITVFVIAGLVLIGIASGCCVVCSAKSRLI